MNADRIQAARRRFLGSRLWEQTERKGDDANAAIVVSSYDIEPSASLDLTLGDLRALKADLESNDAASFKAERDALKEQVAALLPACRAAADLIDKLENEWMHTTPEGQMVRAALAKVEGTSE